jgi:hypothetical protein
LSEWLSEGAAVAQQGQPVTAPESERAECCNQEERADHRIGAVEDGQPWHSPFASSVENMAGTQKDGK